MRGIFISYRRDDTGGHAGRLAADLATRYGRSRIFIDVDSIPSGVEFGDPIQDALSSCSAALVLIGNGWLCPEGGGAERRIDSTDDWVRKEVAAALHRPDMRVIPVLVEGARMPASEDLSAEIAPLTTIQACRLQNTQWQYDVRGICGALDPVVSPGHLRRFVRRRSSWAKAGLVGLAAAGALVAVASSMDRGPAPGRKGGPRAAVAIEGLRVAKRADRVSEWVVTGTADDPGRNRVYAVAQPDGPPARSTASVVRWYVSKPTRPDQDGNWRAVIVVNGDPEQPLSVVAVIAPSTPARSVRPTPTVPPLTPAPSASPCVGCSVVPAAPADDAAGRRTSPPRRRSLNATTRSLRADGPAADLVVERSALYRTSAVYRRSAARG